MSEEASKTESALSEKDQKILSTLTPGERIILKRLLELHPSDKAFDLFEMMRSEKPGEEIPTYYFANPTRILSGGRFRRTTLTMKNR